MLERKAFFFKICLYLCVCTGGGRVCAWGGRYLRKPEALDSWSWSYRRSWIKWHECWELNLGPEQEQYIFSKLSSISRPRKAFFFFSKSLVKFIIFYQALEKTVKSIITHVTIHFWLELPKGSGGLAPCTLSGLTELQGWPGSIKPRGWKPFP